MIVGRNHIHIGRSSKSKIVVELQNSEAWKDTNVYCLAYALILLELLSTFYNVTLPNVKWKNCGAPMKYIKKQHVVLMFLIASHDDMK